MFSLRRSCKIVCGLELSIFVGAIDDHRLVTNEEVRAKIQQVIGPHEDLLTIVKRH